MWPDRVSHSGPLTYESCALPTALRGPAAIWLQEVGTFAPNKCTPDIIGKKQNLKKF